MIIVLLHLLLSLYIVTESFCCFYRMHRGDVFCRMAKYTFACITPLVGIGLLLYKQPQAMQIAWVIPDVAIALFFWPTTYARFTGGFKNRIGDR